MQSTQRMIAISVGVFSLLIWLFVGYFKSYLDEDVQTHLFIKKYPSFQVKFFDMFATEADDKDFEALTAEERREYFEYCHFRFGTVTDENSSLELCKNSTPSYLER